MVSASAVAAGAAWVDTENTMKLLNFLVESFVGAFGITKPKPEQQRTVALALGGFLLIFFTALVSLIVWMLFGQQR
jgi:NAD dependent epimerase/dehydratase family enzyme